MKGIDSTIPRDFFYLLRCNSWSSCLWCLHPFPHVTSDFSIVSCNTSRVTFYSFTLGFGALWARFHSLQARCGGPHQAFSTLWYVRCAVSYRRCEAPILFPIWIGLAWTIHLLLEHRIWHNMYSTYVYNCVPKLRWFGSLYWQIYMVWLFLTITHLSRSPRHPKKRCTGACCASVVPFWIVVQSAQSLIPLKVLNYVKCNHHFTVLVFYNIIIHWNSRWDVTEINSVPVTEFSEFIIKWQIHGIES